MDENVADKNGGRRSRGWLTFSTVMVILFGYAGVSINSNRDSDSGAIRVSVEDYLDEWPFPGFDQGWIDCEIKRVGSADRALVTIRLGGTTYGLNGAAMGVGGFPDHTHLLKKHPDEWIDFVPGASAEFIRTGLDICGRS